MWDYQVPPVSMAWVTWVPPGLEDPREMPGPPEEPAWMAAMVCPGNRDSMEYQVELVPMERMVSLVGMVRMGSMARMAKMVCPSQDPKEPRDLRANVVSRVSDINLCFSKMLSNFSIGIAGPRGRPGKPGTNGTPGVPGINAWKLQYPNGSSSNDLLIPPSITGKLTGG